MNAVPTPQVHIRLSESELKLVKEAAVKDSRSTANWCNMVLVREAMKLLGAKGEAPKKGDDDAGFE